MTGYQYANPNNNIQYNIMIDKSRRYMMDRWV